ncbi:MAG: hypothetical protein JWM85_2391 [Acidimicrobiaceae bacterium]|nr:hypothetical protein [Acidimicrobiaceae bacterium]
MSGETRPRLGRERGTVDGSSGPRSTLRPVIATGSAAAVAPVDSSPAPPSSKDPSAERRLLGFLRRHRFAIGVYLASRVLLLVVGVVGGTLQHHASLSSELANWDGVWYLRVATHFYPTQAIHYQTTLGFLPLYPVSMWLLSHALFLPLTLSGLLISGGGGLVATLLVERLTKDWWGAANARRAVLFFCVFPGSVVFSMVYSEGLLIPLAAGCLLCLQQRRYVLAGVLAGLATAVGPDALALVPAVGFAALREIRSSGWRSRASRRGLLGLACSPLGTVGFGVYLWARTGTPLASLHAQRDGWGEKTDALALVHQGQRLGGEISFSHFHGSQINLNLLVGLIGAALLAVALVLLVRGPARIPGEAFVFVLGMAALTVTSENVPPNPRLLITAFPALLVIVCHLRRRGFAWLIGVNVVLLVVMSAITYVGIALRP